MTFLKFGYEIGMAPSIITNCLDSMMKHQEALITVIHDPCIITLPFDFLLN